MIETTVGKAVEAVEAAADAVLEGTSDTSAAHVAAHRTQGESVVE